MGLSLTSCCRIGIYITKTSTNLQIFYKIVKISLREMNIKQQLVVQNTYTISKFVKFASWDGIPPVKKLLFKYLDVQIMSRSLGSKSWAAPSNSYKKRRHKWKIFHVVYGYHNFKQYTTSSIHDKQKGSWYFFSQEWTIVE